MADRDEHRQRRIQDPWQWALGMLSRGKEPAPSQRVVVVDDVARTNPLSRGSIYCDRTTAPAFVGTHSAVELRAGPSGARLWMLTSGSGPTGVNQPLQLSAYGGPPVANVVEIDPELAGNMSGWAPPAPGNEFFGPQFGGWVAVAKPYRLFTLTCGQRGPIIIPGAAAQQFAAPDTRTFHTRWFDPPFYVGPGEGWVFIGQIANCPLDLSFVIETPLGVGQQTPEGF